MQCLGIPQRTCYGNSRFPVGSDGPHRGGKERQLRYNSRTLAGATGSTNRIGVAEGRFNSRTPCGGATLPQW